MCVAMLVSMLLLWALYQISYQVFIVLRKIDNSANEPIVVLALATLLW